MYLSRAYFYNCTFVGNSAYNGGGVAINVNSIAHLFNNTFQQNTASLSGGGVYVVTYSGSSFGDNIFYDNTASLGTRGGSTSVK